MAVEVEAPGLDALRRGFEAMPAVIRTEEYSAMEESVDYGKEIIAARTPKRTGRLAARWQTRVERLIGDVVGHIYNTTPYAGFVERGTRPHEIRPRVKQALFWPGAWHPVKRVHHPGSFGRHMGKQGIAAAMPGILGIFRRHMKRAISSTLRIR